MTFSFDLTGKTALVTGANTGLGQGIALALAQAGASIVAVGRSSMDETERLCREAGAAFHSVQADLSSLEPIERIVSEAVALTGRIDILVNNAGSSPHDKTSFFDSSIVDWNAAMNANLLGAVRMIHAFVPAMRARGWGRVIQISLRNAISPYAHLPAYGAAKAR